MDVRVDACPQMWTDDAVCVCVCLSLHRPGQMTLWLPWEQCQGMGVGMEGRICGDAHGGLQSQALGDAESLPGVSECPWLVRASPPTIPGSLLPHLLAGVIAGCWGLVGAKEMQVAVFP